MEPDQLTEINEQLADPPDFDVADADRLGLFVAGRLAARHGVEVSLAPCALPGHQGDRAAAGHLVIRCRTARRGPGKRRYDRPSLRASEALSLVGTARARSLATATRTASPARPARWTGTTRPRTRRTTTPSMTRALSTACRAASGRTAARQPAAGGGEHAAAGPAGPAHAHVPPRRPRPRTRGTSSRPCREAGREAGRPTTSRIRSRGHRGLRQLHRQRPQTRGSTTRNTIHAAGRHGTARRGA